MLRSSFAILFIAVLFSCKETTVKVDKEKERLEKVCDDFMVKYSNGQVAQAMDLLKSNSVLPHSQIDTLRKTANKHLATIFTAYGKTIGFEFVEERKIKDFIVKRFYILKFEKYYLKFDFLLYNNGKTWVITAFNYSKDLMEVLF